jgi:hypothetical protein
VSQFLNLYIESNYRFPDWLMSWLCESNQVILRNSQCITWKLGMSSISFDYFVCFTSLSTTYLYISDQCLKDSKSNAFCPSKKGISLFPIMALSILPVTLTKDLGRIFIFYFVWYFSCQLVVQSFDSILLESLHPVLSIFISPALLPLLKLIWFLSPLVCGSHFTN